jgi:hypothetical protein
MNERKANGRTPANWTGGFFEFPCNQSVVQFPTGTISEAIRIPKGKPRTQHHKLIRERVSPRRP